jgi:hypothetical protein
MVKSGLASVGLCKKDWISLKFGKARCGYRAFPLMIVPEFFPPFSGIAISNLWRCELAESNGRIKIYCGDCHCFCNQISGVGEHFLCQCPRCNLIWELVIEEVKEEDKGQGSLNLDAN